LTRDFFGPIVVNVTIMCAMSLESLISDPASQLMECSPDKEPAGKVDKSRRKPRKPLYQLTPDGSFQIFQYDQGPPFSSFLPGIAGRQGIPLWCLYVNRAQCVVSFGVRDKDHAIAEFLPATWAYQMVGLQGFRTFCKTGNTYYEPFQNNLSRESTRSRRLLTIESDRIKISEVPSSYPLQFEMQYLSVVDQPVAALIRVVKITNRSTGQVKVSVLDGLPLILPAGFTDFGIKKMRRIHEAYASVRLIGGSTAFYSSRVRVHDEAEVGEVEEGNFFAAWLMDGDKLHPIEPVVDPGIVFGIGNDLVIPRIFIEEDHLDRNGQVWENRMPCAFAGVETILEAGKSIRLIEMFGHAHHESMANHFLQQVRHQDDIQRFSQASKDLIHSVTLPAFTRSSRPEFDAYCRQNYLDNLLRGGIPEFLPSREGDRPVYLYGRRHGDLERDYNDFVVPDEPLSSGPGNFRDILQNRRHNVWFHPELKDTEIRLFLSLIQADGYNPLAIDGYRWIFPRNLCLEELLSDVSGSSLESLKRILEHPFSPGSLVAWAMRHEIPATRVWSWAFRILQHCDTTLAASGHEGGYWIDHWTYVTDLLESFAAIWPDELQSMLTETADIGWFWNGARVKDRSEKYQLRPQGPLQLHAVQDGPPIHQGLPPVTPFAKLCTLCAVKALSFDSQGIGIEMEAGRPGWNDSLNGLPALFGSSTCETAELARLARWLRKNLPQPPTTTFPLEVAEFLESAITLLREQDANWDSATHLREDFRHRVYQTTTGLTKSIEGNHLETLLQAVECKASKGLEAAKDPETGLVHTYYIGKPGNFSAVDVTDPSRIGQDITGVSITNFHHESLPLFLEGQVHLLRNMEDPGKALQIYRSVRNSPLFDHALCMYKLNDSLRSWPATIGRARTFTRGWFENESVWPHMSYKYLLEILRAGLIDQFFRDSETMLVPFMDPAIYGRSILENSSFIASSVCPDPKVRGQGFVARLSGATAEFIHIWLILTVGERPFYTQNGLLRLSLSPVLPGTWFHPDETTLQWNGKEVPIPGNTFTCVFLGKILLIYINPARSNTYGTNAVRPGLISIDDEEPVQISNLAVSEVERIRDRKCDTLKVWLETK